jgi:predicted DNA-binding protein
MTPGRQTLTVDTKVKTSFMLPSALHRKLKIAAVTEGRDMAELVTEALDAYLTKGVGRGTK